MRLQRVGHNLATEHVYTYVLFLRFFSTIGCYEILSIVPRAIQRVLGICFLCANVYVNSKLLVYLSHPFPFGLHEFVFVSVSLFLFCKEVQTVFFFQIPRISDIRCYLSFSI